MDRESLINTVAERKQKLFGKGEVESYRYNRQKIGSYSNVEPQDELLQAIESALQPTSYMEEDNNQPLSFSDVGGATSGVTPPIHDEHSGRYSLDTSPNDHSIGSPPVWSRPNIDDTPTISTFTANQDTMYRSIV